MHLVKVQIVIKKMIRRNEVVESK